jgi:ferredoxin-NADP reductase/Na+-translocating ferredoxin:NAD+ oxidoreductase RnfD subunit
MWLNPIELIDNILNKITMYRLVLYVLIGFFSTALILTFFNLLPFTPGALLLSLAVILTVSKISNDVFAEVYQAPTNVESVYITALILAFIISPALTFANLGLMFWGALIATSSKYIFAVNRKHLFNPAAFSAAVTAIFLNQSASWWIGNAYMALPVAFGSFLIIRKIKRQEMINGFIFTVVLLSLGLGLIKGDSFFSVLNNLILHSSLLFFSGIMLTEPLTSPTTRNNQFIFGALVGFLFVPQVHIGNIYFTPEQALIIGNIFAYIVSPKQKLFLKLIRKIRTTPDTYDFLFSPDRNINFRPGQYLEWTFAHQKPDSRGNRRYFTIASSPTEKEIRIGIKFPPTRSSYKNALLNTDHPALIASQLSGDFTLPENPSEKIALIAGGIGITPFRSMIKYLTDTDGKRDIILIYSNKTDTEIAYRDVLDQAATLGGIRIIYHQTGVTGHFNRGNFPGMVPDYTERLFYISGPHTIVSATENLLKNLGVKPNRIKTDFFPGFV